MKEQKMISMTPITTHQGNLLNDSLKLSAFGDPGNGGAHWRYLIERNGQCDTFQFQQGNPADEINGISNEVVLAILIHRMEGFQSGPFRCNQNDVALNHLKAALFCFQDRTGERLRRGVEGTLTP